MLVAAMNPCPCGFFGDATRECRCTPGIIQRYLGKISGPLLDRIDIHIEVPAVPYKETARQRRERIIGRHPRRAWSGRAALQRARGFLQLPHAFAADPQAVRAGRCRRAHARNGGAAAWGSPRARTTAF